MTSQSPWHPPSSIHSRQPSSDSGNREYKAPSSRIREEIHETGTVDVDSLQRFARVASRDKPCSEKMTRRAG